MRNIVAELVEILKRETDFLEKERQMMIFLYGIMQEIVRQAFSALDQELAGRYTAKGYKIDRNSERTMTFLFGTLPFTRRRLVGPTREVVYPLDSFLGIQKKRRYSLLVMRNVSELATMMVYRHTEKAVELLTPFTMSHQEAQLLVKQTGKLVEAGETAESRYDGFQERRHVSVLYLEGDSIEIKGQRKQHLAIHRFQVYEGSRKNGKRSELLNCHYVSSMDRKKAMKEMTQYIQNEYDLSHTVVISNSDGGSGYEKAVFDEMVLGCQQHEHFRDLYHVHRKIKERLNFVPPKLRSFLQEAIHEHDWGKVIACLDTAESLAEGPMVKEQEEQVRLLRNYLQRNWEFLKNMKQRGLHCPACIGTCESNHRKYTYRMKRQGRLWLKPGSEAMVRLIDAFRNEEIDHWLNQKIDQGNPLENELKRKKMKRFSLSKGGSLSHEGSHQGKISNYGPSSTSWGQLAKGLNGLEMTPNFL